MTSDERLSKFLNERGKFSATAIKRRVMEPLADGNSSVFVTTGMVEPEVWQHADAHYGPAIARGDLTVQDVVEVASETSTELRVVWDVPPPLHANITGFPNEKERVMEVAQLLANKCGEPRIRPVVKT